jgi:kynurenine 3-monooxygenase
MPETQFAVLEADPSGLPAFFDSHFPGVTSLITAHELVSSFEANPHLPLISIKCRPYHFSSSVVIIGDAAHAMVPFYGQGMNAGLEDVRTLFSVIDKHTIVEGKDSDSSELDDATSLRELALMEYSTLRVADAHAINDLALQNYVEMRASVLSRMYRMRKFVEEFLSSHFPSLGWHTQYSRVSFGNERYSEVVKRSQHQGKILTRGLLGLLFGPLLLGSMGIIWTRHRSVEIRNPFEVLKTLVRQIKR